MAKQKPMVTVVMGSDSDWPVMQESIKLLKALGIPCEARVISAHRTPETAEKFAKGAEKAGMKIIIAAAGGAAHLAGVMASMTTLPVIGVPLTGWALDGMDALLATVQMPGGIPVASMAIGKAGAKNAAIFAGQILGLSNKRIAAKVKALRAESADTVAGKDRQVRAESRKL
jgi:phosphoribosylaminoimidazole carboxylase PurE protein